MTAVLPGWGHAGGSIKYQLTKVATSRTARLREHMEAIVLAGGLGTRLRSRVSDRPKVMADIAGRPFLQILLDQLVAHGCHRLILSVGYMRDCIIHAFGYSHREVPIDYVVEETPLGTGGAIRLALSEVRGNSALVLNGDTFLDLDYQSIYSFHAASSCPLTVAITRVRDMGRYGGVLTEGSTVAGFSEKGTMGPGWINGGVYVMSRRFPWPEGLGSRFSFETDVLMPDVSTLRPSAFRCAGKFLDIGVPEDLDKAQIELATLGPSTELAENP
jgi:D-glycero-alpha-D-manno-heptose 1-phosphate guanylyltransferase